jgi:hypothetical protein
MRSLSALALALPSCAVILLASDARAASITIGPGDCDSCAGLTLGLEANQVGDDVEVFLSYTAPAGWSGGEGDGYTTLVQAGFKAASGWDADDISLVAITVDGSAYANFDDWSDATEANNSSSGPFCTTGTNSNKGCTYALNGDGSIDLAGGGTVVFEFLIADANLIADTADWHIGGQLCDTRANPGTCNGRIISEDGSNPSPEPTAALAFAAGLAALSIARRR